MSDSLRDQLKQAGFVEKTPKPRSKKKPHAAKKPNAKQAAQRVAAKEKQQKATQRDAEIAARKETKAAIVALIEKDQYKDFVGEAVYSYTLQNKIRQLFVKEEARIKLISGELVITRLNGATYLVPEATGTAILAINPQWLIVSSRDEGNDSAEYQDFPVPDDLQW